MTMRASARGAGILLAVAAMGLSFPFPACGQDYDVSAGWGGGYISYAPFVERGATSAQDIGMSATWVALLQAESWQLQRWVGVRLGGFYSRGTVTYPTAEKKSSVFGIETAALIRVIPPAPGRAGSAYLIGGGGLMWFELGEGPAVPIAGADVIYDPDERRQWMLLGGGGIELMTGLRALDGQIGVRLEAVDQIAMGRPFRDIGGADPELMHNLRFSVALFSGVPKLF